MDTVMIKGRLHEYIERADDKHLEAIYILLEKEITTSHQYDQASLDMLYSRRDNHIEGKSKSYTVNEAFDSIRANNSKR
jgi:hypothetical protein